MNTTVIRNNRSLVLSKQVFGKKSPNAGKEFYAPSSAGGLPPQEYIEWFGLTDVLNTLDRSARKIFGDIYLDNVDKTTGILNEEQMELDWADFSAGYAKLSDIDDQLDDLQALQQSYALDDQFGETVDGTTEGPKTERAMELERLITETALRIKPLRIQKSTIEAKYAERTAKREKKKAAVAA